MLLLNDKKCNIPEITFLLRNLLQDKDGFPLQARVKIGTDPEDVTIVVTFF